MNNNFASESGHWYLPDGTPFYTIIGKNGVERPVTLRDARPKGAYPSVTGIINCAAKPGLENWKLEQMKLAALTLPRMPGETEKDWLDRVDHDSKEQARRAADRGTQIHGYLERYYLGHVPTDEEWVFVRPVKDEILKRTDGAYNCSAEKTFAHPLGFGGKCDLHNDQWVIDFKTKDKIEEGKRLAWDDQSMQLAACRVGLNLPESTRCANVFVSTTEPVKVVWHEHSEDELTRGWTMFEHLLGYWQAKNKYWPV